MGKTKTRQLTKLHCVICGEAYPLTKFRAHARQDHYPPDLVSDWKDRINKLVEDAEDYVRRYVQRNPDSDYFFI